MKVIKYLRWVRTFAKFILVVIPFLSVNGFAGFYTDLPDILHVEPVAHPELAQELAKWSTMKEGLVEAVAEYLGAYPDAQLIFLARDGEELFFTAKYLLTQLKDYKNLARIRLVNVSREHIGTAGNNQVAANLKKYLKQEGISQAALDRGTQFVFIDTGLRASIPQKIKTLFKNVRDEQFKNHLLLAGNWDIPNTRVFLQSFDENAAKLSQGFFHDHVVDDLEHIPRYFDRSATYALHKGQWVAVTPDGRDTPDGKVDPVKARARMEDLRAFLNQPKTLEHFKKRLEFWHTIGILIQKRDKKGIESQVHQLLTAKDPLAKSIGMDVMEIISRNFVHAPELFPNLEEEGIYPEELPESIRALDLNWSSDDKAVFSRLEQIRWDSKVDPKLQGEIAHSLLRDLLKGSLSKKIRGRVFRGVLSFVQRNEAIKPAFIQEMKSYLEPSSEAWNNYSDPLPFVAEILTWCVSGNPQGYSMLLESIKKGNLVAVYARARAGRLKKDELVPLVDILKSKNPIARRGAATLLQGVKNSYLMAPQAENTFIELLRPFRVSNNTPILDEHTGEQLHEFLRTHLR